MNKKKLVLLIAIISVVVAAAVVLGILFLGKKPETIAPYERPYNYDYSDNADYPHSEAVTIDGKLDEDIWQNKKWYQNTTTDNISGGKAKLRVTTAMDEYGIYIASETDDSNVMDANGANTNWVFYLAAGEPGDETYSIAHKVAYDMQGILMRTMINAQVAATVRGEVNSGATEGATLEMFISWKALDIDVTNGLPAYIGIQPYYYAVKSAGTGFDTVQAIYEDHVWTNRFFRFDNTGYINADADGAVLGDATYGLGKTFGWDLTDIQNGVVRSANGETHNRIFFKEFGSNFIVETTIIPVKAIDDARPRGGVVFQDASGVYHGVFLDCYDDILTEGLNGTKNMKNLHIVTISNNNGGWNQHDFLGGIRINPIAETTEGTKLTVIKNGRNFYYFVNDEFFYAEKLDYMASDAIPGLYTIGADIIFKDYSCKVITAEETVTYLNERNAYTVEASSSSGGSVNAPVFVEKGKSYDLSITCNAGYEVGSITVNGEEKIDDARRNAKNGVYTVKNVTENQKVNVKFQKSEESTLTGSFTYDEAAAGKNVNVVINGISNPLLHYEIAANPTKGFTAKLPSGKYDISAVKEDYMYTGTTLTVDGEASVEFKLQPSAFKWYPVVNGYTLTSHLDHWNLTNEENGSVSTSYAIGGKQAPMFFKGSGTDFVAKATINYTTTFYGDGSNYQPDLMGGFNFHVGNQEAYAMVRTSGLCITGFQLIDGLTTYNMLTYPDKIGVDYIFAKSGNDVRIYMNGVEVYKTTWRELSGGMDPNAEYVVGLFSLMDKTADIRYTNYSVNFDSDYARSFINNFSPQWKTISSLSQITNPAGLYRLSGDIKGNTTTVKNFVGKLDCLGHTIETSVPLFEKLQGATVEDLNIKLTKSITGSGVLAAEGCNMTLTDIHVYGADGVTLTAPEGKDVGGLLGQMFVGETSNIKNCTNALDIVNTQADLAAGGLVGFADEWDSNFVNCKNTGTVTAVTYAGGIAGRCHKYNVVFDRCVNDGVVTAQQDAGGLVGFTKWADAQKPQLFKNCVNNGTVTGYAAGGMVGRSADGFMRDVGSVNNGSVIGVGDDNRAGGILGHLQNAAAIFEGSSTGTTGKVTAVNAGGVLGYADGTDGPVLNGCVNNGTICGNAKSGGILGYAIGYDKVIELGTYNGQGCVNNGHVYGDGAEVWAGGIIGGAFQTRTKVENAVNKGTVDTADRAGGIIGFIFEGLFTANNCENEGTVQGYNYTGDIYGTLHNMVPNIDGSGGPGYEDGELPWDGYGLAEAAQRATTYATYGNDGKTTVFVGDSFMDPGFWLPFKTDMAGYDALCLGIGGSTAEDWLNYISTGTFMHNIAPKNVVFNLGNNDIHNDGSVRAEDYAEDMQKLLTTVHEIMPDANIFIYSVAHRNASMTGQNGTVDGANALMKAWCAETEWVTFVDISDQLDTSMLDDGIHPEDKYYAEIFVPALVSAGCVFENEQPKVATPISSLSEITDKAGEYYLTADIIGNTVTLDNFAGVLDGKGFTVETTVPLFDLLSTATVKNLNVKLTGDLTAQGVLANTAETATIQNVTVSGSGKLTAPNGKDVGGFIGTANNTTVLDSVNAIDVIGVSGGYTGGIFGKVGGANGTTISGTMNSGNITSAGANAGGMIGRIDWAQNVTVTDCANSGNISATGEGAGGILGMSAFSTGCEISGCSNAGTITNLHATEGNAGGIAGLVGHESALVISGCANAGEIAGIESTSFNCVSGGILARASFGGTVTVEASVNNGKVSGGMSGGVVGMAWQITLTVDGCTNNGDVTAYGQDAAGVLGRVQSGAAVIFRDSSNNGAVYGNTNAAQLNSYVHTPDGASITWEGDNQQNGSAGKFVVTYTITYEGLAGTTHTNPDSYTDITANSILLTEPTQRESYIFEGWYIGTEKVTSLAGLIGDLTIEAKWIQEGQRPAPDVGSQAITALSQITNMNGVYHLTADIIGNTTTVSSEFTGTLNGCGYTVQTTVPLFTNLRGATIKHLNVELQSDITASGALAGYALNSSFEYVNVFGTYTVKPSSGKAGGFAGKTDESVFKHCSNAVAVLGTSHAGGFLGESGGNVNGVVFQNCVNTGDISTTGNAYAGGLFGYTYGGKVTVSGNSKNEGDITAGTTHENQNAGGLFGRIQGGANVTIEDFVNEGTVTGYRSGGVGAFAHGCTATITDCTNKGKIVGPQTKDFNADNGGILGRADAGSNITLTGCVNDGNVEGSMAAGIVGLSWSSNVHLVGCTNNGNVRAYGEDAAGLVCRFQGGGTCSITDCINNGAITGTQNVQQFTIGTPAGDTTLNWAGDNRQNGSTGTPGEPAARSGNFRKILRLLN